MLIKDEKDKLEKAKIVADEAIKQAKKSVPDKATKPKEQSSEGRRHWFLIGRNNIPADQINTDGGMWTFSTEGEALKFVKGLLNHPTTRNRWPHIFVWLMVGQDKFRLVWSMK